MRSLNARLVVSFLVTLILSLAAFIAVTIAVAPAEPRSAFERIYALERDEAVRAFQRGGAADLKQFLDRLDVAFGATSYLLDANHVDLVSGEVRADLATDDAKAEGDSVRRSSDGTFSLVSV